MEKIFVVILCLVLTIPGQEIKKLRGKPKTLEESFIYLEQMFDDTSLYSFLTLPEGFAVNRLHHGLGMWIRNNWGLWGYSKLKRYFIELKIEHPDNMSGIMLSSFHRYLNKNDFKNILNVNDNASSSAKISKNEVQDLDLKSYFPIGDTIVVHLYASYKKLFTTYASNVRATAIVMNYIDCGLRIKVLTIETDPKKIIEKKIGDIYEVDFTNCDLLPPKNWKYIK